VTTWSSLPFAQRNRAGTIVIGALVAVLGVLLPLAISPAVAAGEDPEVIAAHTASAPRVSLVLATPAVEMNSGLPEAVSVSVAGKDVPTTVTPLASHNMSVAFVIDTGADGSPHTLGAFQSAATEFLLRLPPGAHTMVVAAGSDPRVVAPLDDQATALSAISALRPSDAGSTRAGVLVAAQRLLADAPSGPRIIVAYSHDQDHTGPSVGRLAQAVSRAEAVVTVIPTEDDSSWARLVDRTGGAVLHTDSADLVDTSGRAAMDLARQYVVIFEVPAALPALAQVTVTDNQRRRILEVPLPRSATSADAGNAPADRGPGMETPQLIVVVAWGVLLILVSLLVVREWRRTSSRAGPFSHSQIGSRSTPDSSPPGSSPHARSGPPEAPQKHTPLSTLALKRRSRRTSLSDEVAGLRAAQQGSKSQRATSSQDDHSSRDPQYTNDKSVVLTGSGNTAVKLARKISGPTAVHITGNRAARDFAVHTADSNQLLVNTTEPYNGIRPLDWDGGESTGFHVQATGPWRIKLLPLSSVPIFTKSVHGNGDAVLHFTGNGSTATIIGNVAGVYFRVRAVGANGTNELVNTTHAHAAQHRINPGPQFFEIQATGPWRITIT
jgi:hypothetical protein